MSDQLAPLTPEEEAAIRRDLRPDDQYQYGGWARVVARLLATLDRERREAERDAERDLTDRDNAEEWADKLAYAIGGQAIGEHSNANNPWQNALEIAEARSERRERVDPDLRAEMMEHEETREALNTEREMAADQRARIEALPRTHDWISRADVLAILAATPDHTEGEAIRREAEAIVEGIRGDVGVDTGELAEATRRFRERFDR